MVELMRPDEAKIIELLKGEAVAHFGSWLYHAILIEFFREKISRPLLARWRSSHFPNFSLGGQFCMCVSVDSRNFLDLSDE